MHRIQKRVGEVLRKPFWLLSRPPDSTVLLTAGGRSHSFELQEELLKAIILVISAEQVFRKKSGGSSTRL